MAQRVVAARIFPAARPISDRGADLLVRPAPASQSGMRTWHAIPHCAQAMQEHSLQPTGGQADARDQPARAAGSSAASPTPSKHWSGEGAAIIVPPPVPSHSHRDRAPRSVRSRQQWQAEHRAVLSSHARWLRSGEIGSSRAMNKVKGDRPAAEHVGPSRCTSISASLARNHASLSAIMGGIGNNRLRNRSGDGRGGEIGPRGRIGR